MSGLPSIVDAVRQGTVAETFKRSSEYIAAVMQNAEYLGQGYSGVAYIDRYNNTIIKIQPIRSATTGRRGFVDVLSDEKLYKAYPTRIRAYDTTIIEAAIMQEKISDRIPLLYDFGYFYDEADQFGWKSFIVMSIQKGEELGSFRARTLSYVFSSSAVSTMVLHLWRDFLVEMQRLYNRYRFVHADINDTNLFVSDEDEDGNHTGVYAIRMIDFGRSTVQLKGIFFYPNHFYIQYRRYDVYDVLPPEEFELIPGPDICKLLQYCKCFRKEFEALLDTCGSHDPTETRAAGQKAVRGPLARASPELTYQVAIDEIDYLLSQRQ